MLSLEFEDYISGQEEFFELKHDAKSGTLKGKWKNSKNISYGVSLQNEFPKSVSDLIAALTEADKFMVRDYNIRNLNQKDDFKKFFGTAYAQYIPGFLDVLPEFIHSP